MAKGTAIIIKAQERDGTFEGDASLAVAAVNSKYEAQMRSQQGWYGIAVVNLEPNEERGIKADTILVKVTAAGAEVYTLAGMVPTVVKVQTGKFKAVK
jgi:hypothetical protein